MIECFIFWSNTLKSSFILMKSVKLCFLWTWVLKCWIKSSHLHGSPSNWKSSITERHLDSHSNWYTNSHANNLDADISVLKKTVSSTSTNLSMVSSPSTNSSTNASILWLALLYNLTNWILCLCLSVKRSWRFHYDIKEWGLYDSCWFLLSYWNFLEYNMRYWV